MPRERIEPSYLYLQNSALTTKRPRLYRLTNRNVRLFSVDWRKIDSNYHICSASTTDYRLSDFPCRFLCYRIIAKSGIEPNLIGHESIVQTFTLSRFIYVFVDIEHPRIIDFYYMNVSSIVLISCFHLIDIVYGFR